MRKAMGVKDGAEVCGRALPDASRLDCRMSVLIAGAFLGVPPSRIVSPKRDEQPVVLARQVAMYLAHVNLQLPMQVVGHAFGRDRTTVAYALGRIEDRRDEPAFDALLTRMEALVAPCLDLRRTEASQ